ncbi:MAG: ATP-binding protein [Myxococcota bacterium]
MCAAVIREDVERLAALVDYQILDSGPDPAFDGITTLLANMLEVPIACVSLVDAERVWLKSKYGVDVDEFPCDGAFCAQVVADRAPLLVTDATLDPRFANCPFVQGEAGIRFYAGVPLRTAQGHVLGTLCAQDRRPRDLSPKQRECLALLGRQVVALLDLRRKEIILAREHEALTESEERLRALFDGMAEGVILLNEEATVVRCNAAAERMLGLERSEILTRNLLNVRMQAIREDGSPLPASDYPGVVALRTGQSVLDSVLGLRTGERGLVWLSITAQPLITPGASRPHAAVATIRDITAQKAAAKRLAAHERLATTGTLAAGIGHEINNPLAFVSSNLEYALEELRHFDTSGRMGEVVSMLGEAKEGADRIRKIVRGLRALGREEGPAVPTQVANVVEMAVNITLHEIKQRASLSVELSGVPAVLADESRLTQVLVNLLVNAAQAFQTSDLAQNRILIRSRRLESQVEISVQDNGPGIPPEILPRIYDPFFTTKPVGVGTGLGLSVSHAMVSSLNGELICETTLAQGTTFRVRLPVAPEPHESERPPSRGGRVWVIDDEPAILRSVARILQGDYDVLKIWDARDALDRIRAGEQADLVLCDLMMPYLSGIELYSEALRMNPGLAERFVFITGGLSNEPVARFLAEVKNERLEKPFSLQGLRGVAKRVIQTGRMSPEN